METKISQTSRVTPKKSPPLITIIGVVIIGGIIITLVYLIVSGKLNLRNPFK